MVDDEIMIIKKTDEYGQSILVGETVTTLKDPHGNIRKIATIETFDENNEKPLVKTSRGHIKEDNVLVEKNIANDETGNKQHEGELNNTVDNEEANIIDFSKLENFLNPKSGSLRRLIEERVLKHPKILSEMLSVNFSDLVAVFQNLFLQHKKMSIEEVYIQLLDIVDKEGSEGIIRYAASLNNGQQRLSDKSIDDSGHDIIDQTFDRKTDIPDDIEETDNQGSVSDTLRKMIKYAGWDKLANVLTEEEVISEEKRKIQAILGSTFDAIKINNEADKGVKQKVTRENVDNMVGIMSDVVIAQKLEEFKEYRKKVDRTKEKVKILEKNIGSSEEDSTDSKKDEL